MGVLSRQATAALVITAGALALAGCTTAVPGKGLGPVQRQPTVVAVLTVTVDDTRASNTVVQYIDPVSQLAKTDTAIYGWARTLGPFRSLTGDLWLSVDNTNGRATAHCSINVTGHPVVTESIPVGETNACAVHL